MLDYYEKEILYKERTYKALYRLDRGGYWEPDEEVLLEVIGNEHIDDPTDEEIVANGDVIKETITGCPNDP